jgi:hypothetical protein
MTNTYCLGNSWPYEVDNTMTARKLSMGNADLAIASYWLHVCHI